MMNGYQEITIQVRARHLQALQNIAQKEHGNSNEIEKVIFSALLDYFEARSTNQMLEEAVREGLQVLEEHMKVLLDLIKTLLISASYDTTKIRLLLEFLFENDIGKDLIPELYKRTSESVIERLKEEKLENVAQIIAENEDLKRQLREAKNEGLSNDVQKQQELIKQQNRDREYAETVGRLTRQVTEQEELQRKMAIWVNGLINHLTQGSGNADALLTEYMAQHPKPKGIN